MRVVGLAESDLEAESDLPDNGSEEADLSLDAYATGEPLAADLSVEIAGMRSAASASERLPFAIAGRDKMAAYHTRLSEEFAKVETLMATFRAEKLSMEAAMAKLDGDIRQMRADVILAAYPPMQNPPSG